MLVEAERQLEEYFAGRRKKFALKLDLVRDGVSTQGVERTADDPVRRDAILRTDREADRESRRRARGWRGERQKSRVDHRAVPSGHRIHGQAHGFAGGLDVKARLLALEGAKIAQRAS